MLTCDEQNCSVTVIVLPSKETVVHWKTIHKGQGFPEL